MKKILPVALIALAACTQNMVNVNVTVFPDGSGEFQYHAWIPTHAAEGDKANPNGAIQNVRDLRSFDFTLRLIGGHFESIDKVAIGDIAFQLKDRVATVTIPATADSKWYRALGVTEEQLKKLDELAKMDAAKQGTGEMTEDPPAVVIAITMPGKIEKQRLVEPDPAPKWKMDTEERGTFGGDEQKNTAFLVIPIEDLRAGKVKKAVWEITCGPTLDKVKTAWEKFKAEKKEPERVKVQHILVSWSGVKQLNSKLSREEAEKKANDLLEKIRKGGDFTEIMKAESEDPGPGIYAMVNTGVEPKSEDEYPRAKMVRGFGDASFKLKVGQVTIVPFDEKTSPYGWHIIKRLE